MIMWTIVSAWTGTALAIARAKWAETRNEESEENGGWGVVDGNKSGVRKARTWTVMTYCPPLICMDSERRGE